MFSLLALVWPVDGFLIVSMQPLNWYLGVGSQFFLKMRSIFFYRGEKISAVLGSGSGRSRIRVFPGFGSGFFFADFDPVFRNLIRSISTRIRNSRVGISRTNAFKSLFINNTNKYLQRFSLNQFMALRYIHAFRKKIKRTKIK